MKIKQSVRVLVAEIERSELSSKLPEVVLDSTFFPWRIVHQEEGKVHLSPLRKDAPESVSELFNPEEVRAKAQLHRVFDYMAVLESHDWSVTGHVNSFMDVVQSHVTFTQDDRVPIRCVVLVDDRGIEWGPLPLDPFTAPVCWPFPGQFQRGETEVRIVPTHGEFVNVVSSVFEMLLRIDEAPQFVIEVANWGWEGAVKRCFPNGTRLKIGSGPPTGLRL